MIRWTAFGLLLAHLVAAGAQAADSRPSLDVWILEDPDNLLTIEQVAGLSPTSRFRPVDTSEINLGYTSSTWWFRVMPADGRSVNRLIEVAYTQNDRIDIYLPTSRGWRHIAAGDTRPRSPDLKRYPTPLLELPDRLERPVYMSVASNGSTVVPLLLHDGETLIEHVALSQFGFGVYYAFLLAMAVYNFFLLLAVRDLAYGYYVLYLIGLLIFQSSLFGHASLWLWPQWTAWSNLAAVTGVAVMIAAGACFVSRLAQTRTYVPAGHLALIGLAATALAILPLMFIDYRSAVMAVTVLGALAVVLIYPIPVVLSYIRGCRQSRFVVLALVLFLPGVVLLALRTMGLVTPSWWSEHGLQLGTAAEVMLFSFALADRINTLNSEKLAARQALVNAHDSERRRIARELHDGLGQNLLLLASRLRRHEDDIPQSRTLRELSDDCLSELRVSVSHLHPHQLDRLGLKRALESMLDSVFESTSVNLECEINPPSVTDEQALQLYRIVQEGISNILRHANASEAKLRLRGNRHRVELEIIDNGRGISPDDRGHGHGLDGIRSRARMLGGRIHIGNVNPQGTRIHLIVPHHHA